MAQDDQAQSGKDDIDMMQDTQDEDLEDLQQTLNQSEQEDTQ